DMTRFSEGRFSVNKEFEAVDDIVNQTLTHVAFLSASGRLHVFVPEDIIIVPVEGKLIVQVLVNLLDNAYKHAGEDAQIYFKAYSDDNSAIFEISDNGVGIDPSIISNIFDGFVTLHKNNIVDANLGVGLGLTICKEIVTAHKGTISAKNSDTGGAVFKVVLPLEVD
ncbi:MAG: sensor histidine kinase, partial [Sedimentibacter sp.]